MLHRTDLDLPFIRRQYPKNHWDWAFFENAGGAFVPHCVIQRISAYMTQTQVQPGYPYPESIDAADRMNLGHKLMAEFVGADIDEITVSASTSFNVYVLAQALRHLWKKDDEIIVATLNHEANSGPWRRLEEFGLKIVEWPIESDTAELNLDTLHELLTEKTQLVAFPHVSNVAGNVNDVAAITKLAHSVGALVCVDGVAYAPHRALRVKEWDVDFYLFSFYKVFGPHMGCLYGRRDILQKAKGQYHYFFDEDDLLHKMNPAGPNHESIASLAGIADYFDTLYTHHFDKDEASFFARSQALYAKFAEHEQLLSQKFLDFITSRKDIRLIGRHESDKNSRVPTFSFTSNTMSSEKIARAVCQDKVAISFGHFYAKRLVENLGVKDTKDGLVRCSMAHYNTIDEVEKLIRSLDRVLG